MRFVPVKSAQQQAVLAVRRLREGYKDGRAACINRIRGQLLEFGVIVAQTPEILSANYPRPWGM